MRGTVGVMASSAATLTPQALEKLEQTAEALGEAIARHGLVLFTGETTGLPYLVARAVHKHGGLTVGVSGAHSRREQLERYPVPDESSDVVVYTGFGLKGRNVICVRSSEIVIILAGSIGTLNEFTIAYDEGKLIGVVTGTGGIADRITEILAACPKSTSATLIMNSDPAQLIAECAARLQSTT
jgi:uncharacterized protein (TIGR00725 family)